MRNASGALFGLAYGDALGKPTEFQTYAEIVESYGSIACLAGSFAGAALGLAAWPGPWQTQIEYADRLTRLGAAWD